MLLRPWVISHHLCLHIGNGRLATPRRLCIDLHSLRAGFRNEQAARYASSFSLPSWMCLLNSRCSTSATHHTTDHTSLHHPAHTRSLILSPTVPRHLTCSQTRSTLHHSHVEPYITVASSILRYVRIQDKSFNRYSTLTLRHLQPRDEKFRKKIDVRSVVKI